mgnify:CR=1 FL=1
MKFLINSCFILLMSGSLLAQDFKEGTHYYVVAEEASKEQKITEFFSLFCSHCFQFEPLAKVLQEEFKSNVKFIKSHVDYMPRNNEEVSFGIVKAFVAMEALGKQKELTETFFAAIHLAGAEINSEADIKKLFLQNGITSQEFDEAYTSQKVIDKATQMRKEWERQGVTSVPTLIVNEKFKINVAALGGVEELKGLINYLLLKK